MAGEREPKYFIIPFNGEQQLVKATTKSRAIKGLFRSLMQQAEAGARLASQDELVRLITQGAKPIDVVDQEGAEPEPGADPVGALQQAANASVPAPAAVAPGSEQAAAPAAGALDPDQAGAPAAAAQVAPNPEQSALV